MKKSIGFCEFTDSFRNMNRQEDFSYNGLKALYEYLEEYEESTWEEIDLDVIALCCEFTEYESLEEIQENYPRIHDMDDLMDNTQVIVFDSGIIIQNF